MKNKTYGVCLGLLALGLAGLGAPASHASRLATGGQEEGARREPRALRVRRRLPLPQTLRICASASTPSRRSWRI